MAIQKRSLRNSSPEEIEKTLDAAFAFMNRRLHDPVFNASLPDRINVDLDYDDLGLASDCPLRFLPPARDPGFTSVLYTPSTGSAVILPREEEIDPR